MVAVERAPAPKPTPANVAPMPGAAAKRVEQPAIAPAPQPEPKRSKAERLEGRSGYWAGACHGGFVGLLVGLAAMFLAFLGAAPILADLQGRLAAIDAVRGDKP